MFYKEIIFLVLLVIIGLLIYFKRKVKKPTVIVGDGGVAKIPVPPQHDIIHTITYDADEVWGKKPLQAWWVVYNTSEKTRQYKRVNKLPVLKTRSRLSKVSICATQIIGWSKVKGGIYMSPEVDSSIVVKRTIIQCQGNT